MKPPSLTLGIEEEYQIIDPQTRELTSYITQMLQEDHLVIAQVKPELHQSIVEVGTVVCKTPAEVRAELVKLPRTVSGSPRRAPIRSRRGPSRRSRPWSATSAYARTWGSWRNGCSSSAPTCTSASRTVGS